MIKALLLIILSLSPFTDANTIFKNSYTIYKEENTNRENITIPNEIF